MTENADTSGSDIVLRGARVHNLQNINARIPRHQLTVVTGVSGSGKSSLAFHTLFAEGQRRYLKSLSGRTRHWLGLLPRPDVDVVEGIPPAIAVRQETPTPNARSTVANVTEILDFLRVLFARRGVVHCPTCETAVVAHSVQDVADQVLAFPLGTKVMLLAPVKREEGATLTEVLQRAESEGFVRGRVNGEIIDLSDNPEIDESTAEVEIVVDRLILKEGLRPRLTESLQQTLRVGAGRCLAVIQEAGEWRDYRFQNELRCSGCDTIFPPLTPSLFSWFSAHGACPVCEGAGYIADEIKSDNGSSDGDIPRGKGGKKGAKSKKGGPSSLSREERKTCPACHGARLNPVAANVQVAGENLPALLTRRLPQVRDWLASLVEENAEAEQLMLQRLIEPLLTRLDFLAAVGVSYLSLNRTTETLSGGELQRVRLARCLGTQLQGSCYIVDEPTAGLHARDAERLLGTLRQMIDQGNTVVCVEHNVDVIAAADYLLELGPEGGRGGGQLLFEGSPEELQNVETATAIALRQHAASSAKNTRGDEKKEQTEESRAGRVCLANADLNTLKNVSIELPLNKLTSVSGLSGSGKSTLILESLAPLLRRCVAGESTKVEQEALGAVQIDGVLKRLEVIDQRPAGKSARSCPATFSGMWDDVRKILSRTRYARARGYDSKRFSIMSGAGVCGHCQGRGEIVLQVAHLLENSVVCPVCRGDRFNSATLAVRYQGRSIADLLRMTIDEALQFWSEIEPIVQKLKPFRSIGLGYLSLGQSASSLSGGEAQRMKLARQLKNPQSDGLFILDEPTRGLHWADVERLNRALREIVDQKNTVVVIEHHPLFLREADWHIVLGPGAGEDGGRVLHCGAESFEL